MQITRWHYLIIFCVALAVTVCVVPVVRSIAIRCGIVDQPNARRVNKAPIPRMGGLGMFVGVLVAFGCELAGELTGVWDGPLLDPWDAFSTRMLGVLVGLVVIVAVGIIDDIFSLTPFAKFVGQVAAACIVAATGTLLSNFKLPFSDMVVQLGGFAYPITVIYLVCFVNVINLIDGLDGLAAGISAIAAVSLFYLTADLGRAEAAIAAVVLAGVCIGFLFYNFHPASIFMGDSGSMMLGMLLGTVSLLGAARFSSLTALLVPVVIAGVPVIDTASAIIRRLRGHQPIQVADAGHIHHRLLRAGFSQRKAVLVIYLWTALLCAGAVFIWSFGGMGKYLVLLLMLVVSTGIIWKLGLFGPVLSHHYYPDRAGGVGADADTDEQADANAPHTHEK